MCVFLISPLSSSPDATRNEIRFRRSSYNFTSPPSTVQRPYDLIADSANLFHYVSPVTSRRPSERRVDSRSELALGFFFFFFAYLPKESDRFSFSSSSTSFREIGAFLLSLANPRGNRIALSPCGGGKGEDRTFPPGYDVSSQHLVREKKPVVQKGIAYRDGKREWKRDRTIIGQDSKVACDSSAFAFETSGIYPRIISAKGYPAGLRDFFFFFFFCTFEKFPVRHRRHVRAPFSLESSHLKLALESLDYGWRKSLERTNLSRTFGDFAKM